MILLDKLFTKKKCVPNSLRSKKSVKLKTFIFEKKIDQKIFIKIELKFLNKPGNSINSTNGVLKGHSENQKKAEPTKKGGLR